MHRGRAARGLAITSPILLLLGCGSPPPATAPKVVADPWVLSCATPSLSEPAVLWNGQIGLRIGRDGTGYKQPSFAIDEYDSEGEEKIRSLPNPLDIQLEENGKPMELDAKQPYKQELDMHTGELTTEWQSKTGVTVNCLTVLHPEKRMVGQRWTFSSDHNAKVLVKQGKMPAVAATWSDQDNSVDLQANAPEILDRVVSLGRSDNWITMQAARGIARKMRSGWNAPEDALEFDGLVTESEQIWKRRWHTDIVIDGPAEDQQAIHSFMFYLWGAVSKKGDMSVSPMGLSSTQYNGHVFWDADIWVAPALAFFDPQGAEAIASYRLALQRTAEGNYENWLEAERPTATLKLGGAWKGIHLIGQKFPWESSVSGKETVPGPSKFEDHISGTIAFTLSRAAALGFVPGESATAARGAVGTFYDNRSVKGPDGLRHLNGTMSPDENHVGDDDLYTNLVAMWTTNGGKWPPQPTYYLPKDSQSFLTYTGDRLKGYKQAAAVLSIFPLQYPPAEKQAKAMMDRFADKVTKNGPAMSDSVHATIWARLGEKEKAYSAWRESWQPFTTGPLMLFSEKRSSLKTYFTTGAAGSLNAVIYGFLGFRLDSEQESGAAWSKKVNGGYWLSIKPNLPPQWKSVKFKNFRLLGKSFTLTATPDKTKVD